MRATATLPRGQYEIEYFPRFGLTPFAVRFPTSTETATIQIVGDVNTPVGVSTELATIVRVEQRSDFHCVTTWTRRGLEWGGIRFSDFYRQIVVPLAAPHPDASFVVLHGQDGARASLPLDDLLASDVLLADRLNGQPLSIAHGAPLRLVAPAHYGYKSVKHINPIGFWRSSANYRPFGFRFMIHPSQSRLRRAGPMGPRLAIALSVSSASTSNGVAFQTGPTTHLKSIGRDAG